MMKQLLAVSAMIVAGGALAQAQPPSPARAPQAGSLAGLAIARQVITASHVDQTLDRMFGQLMPILASNAVASIERAPDAPAAFKARVASEAGRKQAVDTVGDELMRSFRARYPQLKEATAAEYARRFTPAELSSILAFYQSGAGARFIELQPVLQQSLSEQGRIIGTQAAQEALPPIIRRLSAAPGATTP